MLPRALAVLALLPAFAAAPASAASILPTDPLFVDQWSLEQPTDVDIDAPAAWSRRTNCAMVAIVDTGADLNHPQLKPNLWTNSDEIAGNGKDDDNNGYVDDVHGVDVRTGGQPIDTNGHGTHVAGIVAARGNDGAGTSGVCWTSKLMIVKFMSIFGSGQSKSAADAIRYAARNGAKIINCSFGSSSPSDALRDAIKYAAKKGALVVVAAGNDGQNVDKKATYPASWPDSNILTVASIGKTGARSSFSNYGERTVDIAAPGEDILSTYLAGGTRTLSGTSMAAPIVAGIAAMVRREDSALSASALREAVVRNDDNRSSLKGKVASRGSANLSKALTSVE